MKSIKCIFAAILSALSLAVCTLYVSADEYLFKFKEGAGFPVTYLSEARLQSEDILASTLGVYKTDDLDMLLEYYEAGLLEFYEENGEVELFAMPNTDDYMSITSGISTSTVPLGYSYSQIGVDALWSLGLTGKGITVAVIDSGVTAHKDIVDNLLSGYNYSLTEEEIAADPSGVYVTRDVHKHGTMVAGLIAANGRHYRGIAYEAKIIPLKCFRDDTGKASVEALAKAMTAAVDEYDCDVINMSGGTPGDYCSIRLAAMHATLKGIPIIAAAGNYGSASSAVDAYYYPASIDSVVSVANIMKDDTLKSSSQKNDKVDVSAPGTYVYGIDGDTTAGYMPNSGTSFSCPIVTGVVALMLQASPDLDGTAVQSLLQSTATDLGDEGKDVKFGYGKVNCAALVPKLLDGKVYRSDSVEYNGTYNVAFRNGLSTAFDDLVALTSYSGGRMTGISLLETPLAYGESSTVSVKSGNKSRLMQVARGTLVPAGAAIDLG